MRFFHSEILRRFLVGCFSLYVHLIKRLRIVYKGKYIFWPARISNSLVAERKVIEENTMNEYEVRTSIIDQEDNARYREKLQKVFDTYWNYPVAEQYVVTMENARLHHRFSVLTARNDLYWDLTWHPKRDMLGNKATWTPYLGNPHTHIPWSVAVATGNDTARNYHHWLTFGLPKIHLFQKHTDCTTLIADTDRSFHREGLALLGIEQSSLVELPINSFAQVDQLTATNTPTIFGKIPSWLREFYHSLVKAAHNHSHENTSSPERIFIIRKGSREIDNMDELLPIFHKHNITPVQLEWLSFVQQICLFAGAKVIIAPHGAGLTNIAFTPAWGQVIELFHEETFFGHYYCMSRSLGHHYTAFIGRKKGSGSIAMDAKISIDPSRFEKCLKEIL